jgi:FdhD protein
MLATPLDLEDFALGFSLTEGIVAEPSEFQGVEVIPEKQGYSIYMSVPAERSAALLTRQRNLPGRSGCGLCGVQMLENALRATPTVLGGGPFTARALQRAASSLGAAQPLNRMTGAVHAAAWSDAEGVIHLLREDVGRHNALDKLVGAMLDGGVDPMQGFALVTSRASYEMVDKAAVAHIPLIAAVSGPTAMALRVAQQSGVSLVGFTRSGRHTLYANSDRLIA